MKKLLECAKAFEKLIDTEYHIVIGRKGKSVDITISFEAVDFHHLIGLHKLSDLSLSRENREKVFNKVLSGRVILPDIEKSRYFSKIQNRIEPFSKLENLFDENTLIFRNNKSANSFSIIQAEYLFSTFYKANDIYIP